MSTEKGRSSGYLMQKSLVWRGAYDSEAVFFTFCKNVI